MAKGKDADSANVHRRTFNGRVPSKSIGNAAIVLLSYDPFQDSFGAIRFNCDGYVRPVF